MISSFLKAIFLIGCLFVFVEVFGQRAYDTTTVSLFNEIENIQRKYSDSIMITGVCYMQHVDSVTTYDTSAISYVVLGQQFKFTFDSIESIQNKQFYVVVYHQDKTVLVQSPVNIDRQLLGVDIHNPEFQKYEMKSLVKRDSGSYSIIKMDFDSLSIYADYEIVYHNSNYEIKELKYIIKQNFESGSTNKVFMKMVFDAYKYEPITDNYFSTTGWLKQNGARDFQLGPLLTSDYEIIPFFDN